MLYAYLRVSGLGQIDGDGFPRQLEACEKYAAAQGLTIAGVYKEEGVCGSLGLEHREALGKLLVQCERGDVVIVEKLDRLARELLTQEAILRHFRTAGIEMVSAREPDLMGKDPERVLFRQIMGAIAEYDRVITVLKLRHAREKIRARGERCEGPKPYGEKPGEGGNLRRLRELREQGLGFDSIARRMNEAGFYARNGGPWYAAGVRRVLGRARGGEAE